MVNCPFGDSFDDNDEEHNQIELVLPALNMPVAVAARKLGIFRQVLHRILAETLAVSPAMAVRLGKFCGNGPNLWLNMQRALDLWRAEREVDVSEIPTMREA